MRKRNRSARQSTLWIATSDLPTTAAHPFYERLNRILDKAGFDGHVETLCAPFYAETMGRPILAPGRYFRLLLIGYFEGLDSERAIAWRAADSFALRRFLDLELGEAPPDHSTISRTRRLIDVETHRDVFTWILKQLAEPGLVAVASWRLVYDQTEIISALGAVPSDVFRHRAALISPNLVLKQELPFEPLTWATVARPGLEVGSDIRSLASSGQLLRVICRSSVQLRVQVNYFPITFV